ncbi:peptidyl-prolyl cis-trans isomerase [Pseudooceanicola sp. C21-150M6]|uniref:peptidyl-prolyl cis-trans isomerase n=1 Tax=Pseudooceanicola sp. C21-150M6 TaxID=3434355 RepID=UPI003D7FF9BE
MASKGSKTAVWILMALLVLGLGGFGATSFSSSLRSLGSVGDETISVDDYVRALQQQLRSLQQQTGQAITMEQAQAFGLSQQVMSELITQAALDHEASQADLSVGDPVLADQLRGIAAFRGIDGQFDPESYNFALQQAGLTKNEFEEDLRSETVRAILQSAVLSGRIVPETYVDTMLDYAASRRRVTWVRVDNAPADGLDTGASDEDLQALYEEEIDQFTRPERKLITYAWLTPAMILDQVELDDELLRAEYQKREGEFNKPERRLVERLVFTDQGRADMARGQIDDGSSTFEDLVRARGLQLSDTDMGDVTQTDLGDAAGQAVFAAETGDVVGPVDTDLGPALFRVNGILSAEVTDFEDAEAMIRDDLAFDRAARQSATQAEPVEDLLASGATLEEVAAETDLQLGSIEWAPGQTEGIAAYEEFDAAAAELTDSDFPTVKQLTDGGIFAMRLDEILPPEPIPFAEVRDRVLGIWETRRNMDRLRAEADTYKARLAEAADFDSLGLEVKTEEALTRSATVLGTPQSFAETAFDMQPGEIRTLDGYGAVVIMRLDEILPPNLEDGATQQLRDGLTRDLSNSISQDIFRIYAEDARVRAGMNIDQQAIAQVNASLQ